MELEVIRQPSRYGATIGSLQLGGEHICYTLEDQVREVPGQPVSTWKVQDETAIPMGRYRVSLVDSPKFGPDTLCLLEVPGFMYIRIHCGNVAGDTDGCILVGMNHEGSNLSAGTSRPALALLKDMLVPAIKRGEAVWLTIKAANA